MCGSSTQGIHRADLAQLSEMKYGDAVTNVLNGREIM
jgi:hypothetical protein